MLFTPCYCCLLACLTFTTKIFLSGVNLLEYNIINIDYWLVCWHFTAQPTNNIRLAKSCSSTTATARICHASTSSITQSLTYTYTYINYTAWHRTPAIQTHLSTHILSAQHINTEKEMYKPFYLLTTRYFQRYIIHSIYYFERFWLTTTMLLYKDIPISGMSVITCLFPYYLIGTTHINIS